MRRLFDLVDHKDEVIDERDATLRDVRHECEEKDKRLAIQGELLERKDQQLGHMEHTIEKLESELYRKGPSGELQPHRGSASEMMMMSIAATGTRSTLSRFKRTEEQVYRYLGQGIVLHALFQVRLEVWDIVRTRARLQIDIIHTLLAINSTSMAIQVSVTLIPRLGL